MKASTRLLLSWQDTLGVFAYSLLFVGVALPTVGLVCMLMLLPFLGGGWLGGMAADWLFHVKHAYIAGGWLAVFLQAYLVLAVVRVSAVHHSRGRDGHGADIPEGPADAGASFPADGEPADGEPADAMRCAKCGAEVRDARKACPTCGAPAEIPAGVKGWSWGALLLNWIWSLSNGPVWLGLLSLVPYFGFIMAIVLGFKGREWAWRACEWDSVEQFQIVQRRWSRWGIGLFGGMIVLSALGAVAIPAYQQHQRDAALHAPGGH